ncbi:MAG: carbon-nitrogen hydrolase family protein [Verrucomicrobia bacterium]|nr:carbon-nitrogen hydrolase family protein [Verrucomicrobiota bacterium]
MKGQLWLSSIERLGKSRPVQSAWGLLFVSLALSCGLVRAGDRSAALHKLNIGVVQMALGQTLGENRDRIVAGISTAAALGVRVVVFPEGALRGEDDRDPVLVEEAVAAVRKAARDRNVYVLFGGATYSPKLKKETNWMFATGPDGRDLLRYDKLYDQHDAPMPGVFHIDGIPCSAMICADRWLRGVEELPILQGAQISFELSCNFASEWVPPFEWYWYVPRALRNTVWVIFANTGNKVSGVSDTSATAGLRHGHSAVIAPDGRIVAASPDDAETIVVAELDISKATRADALVRAGHPALRGFWEAGLKLHRGQAIPAAALTPLKSIETELTVAAAQTIDNLSSMVAMIGAARAQGADLIVFPERAIAESALDQLRAAARENQITVVVGMEHAMADGTRRNSAFVIGPAGTIRTRYDQLSATDPYQPGTDPASMWFRVKNVPAAVTIGKDALWTELSELAAVAGAQVRVHLDHDTDENPNAELRRVQVWSNLASFLTFTVTANVVGSAIWDDLRDLDERRAEVRGLPRPDNGPVEVYSPFSANLVVRAKAGPDLIVATRRVGRVNPYHPRRTSNFNPQMEAWYRLGAQLIQPKR